MCVCVCYLFWLLLWNQEPTQINLLCFSNAICGAPFLPSCQIICDVSNSYIMFDVHVTPPMFSLSHVSYIAFIKLAAHVQCKKIAIKMLSCLEYPKFSSSNCKGRLKMSWMEAINGDVRELGIYKEYAADRARWRKLIGHVDRGMLDGWWRSGNRLTQVDLGTCQKLHVVVASVHL